MCSTVLFTVSCFCNRRSSYLFCLLQQTSTCRRELLHLKEEIKTYKYADKERQMEKTVVLPFNLPAPVRQQTEVFPEELL